MFLARINKELFNELLKKTNRTPQRVYQLIQAKRKEYGYTISREEAAYLFAAQLGIDISKYIEKEESEKLQRLREIIIANIRPFKRVKTTRTVQPRSVTISFGKEKIKEFTLSAKLAKDAEKMAEVYPLVYVLENSLRYIIAMTLRDKYGDGWWEKTVPFTIRRNAENRVKFEGRHRWHSKRGSHKIFYTDFGDLSSIIINNWEDFKNFFPSQRWIQTRLEEIELSRHIIAHNNPLPKREVKRLKLYFEDLRKQIIGTYN